MKSRRFKEGGEILTIGENRFGWVTRGPYLETGLQIQPHEANLRIARERGMDPISFSDVYQKLGDSWDSWVLFDTSSRPIPGNHWRVLEVDRQQEEVKLQFCGRFGTYDHKGIEPFRISIHEPFFTGVSVQKFVDAQEGDRVSLPDVHKRVEGRDSMKVLQGLEHSEEIYWSEGAGPHLGLVDFKYIKPQRSGLFSSG